MISVGNTNRAIDALYYYLWYKDDNIKDGIYTVRIPDTIIYKYGRPHIWYFTNLKGEILIKKDESRSNEHIMKKFMKDDFDGKVVGYFIYPAKYNYHKNCHTQEYVMNGQIKKGLQKVDFDEQICIFYMTKEMLVSFLDDPSKPPEGILQKFVEPYGEHETLIQAVWSPSVCLLSKQQNHRSLNDKRYDPYERCVTFDGAEVFSRAVPIRGREISQSVRSQVKMIVEKITNISYEKINISRVVLYFKPDKNNVIWFLFASCLRTMDEDKASIDLYRQVHLKWKNNPCKQHHNTPVNLATNYAQPYNIKRQQTTNTIHPAKLIKDIVCYDCERLCQQKDLFEINYGQVIDTFNQNPDCNPIKNATIAIMELDDTSRPPLISRVFVESTDENKFQVKSKNVQYLRDIHSHIPPLILKIYPNITVDYYDNLRLNDRFLAKTIRICQACWLRYSEVHSRISGAEPKNKPDLKFFRRSLASKTKIMQNAFVKDAVVKLNKELSQQKREMLNKVLTVPTTILSLAPQVPTLDISNCKQSKQKPPLSTKYYQSFSSTTKHQDSTTRPFTSHTISKSNHQTTRPVQDGSNNFYTEMSTQAKNISFLEHYTSLKSLQVGAEDSVEIESDWNTAKTMVRQMNQ